MHRTPARARAVRVVLVTVVTIVAVVVPARPVAAASPGRAGGVPALVMPVDGAVVRRFDAPTTYGPGHRGVDLAAVPGTPVRSPVTGTVGFAGAVAGATWVTVTVGRVRVTVGPLRSVDVRRGTAVVAGQRVGTTATAHGLDALHLSVRVGERYVDPLASSRAQVSLVPLEPVDGVRWARPRHVPGGRSPHGPATVPCARCPAPGLRARPS